MVLRSVIIEELNLPQVSQTQSFNPTSTRNNTNQRNTTMTEQEQEELLRLTRENNIMLRNIIQYLRGDNSVDFMQNIIANLIANGIEQRGLGR